jgi:hypothetical protein
MGKRKVKKETFHDSMYKLVRDIRRSAGLEDLTSKEFNAAFFAASKCKA